MRTTWLQIWLRRWLLWLEAPPLPNALAVRMAVWQACGEVGLDVEHLTSRSDLVRTGKLYDVLHHAASALHKNHELRTVQDVIDWLQEAPTA